MSVALFVFNSRKISDDVSRGYGSYAQGQFFKAMYKVLQPQGGWRSVPFLQGCYGDLLEEDVFGRPAGVNVLTSWLKAKAIDVSLLDGVLVDKLRTVQSGIGYIPTAVGIAPISKPISVAVHENMTSVGVVGYLGLIYLTGQTDLPSVADSLCLFSDLQIVAGRCVGEDFLISKSDLNDAGLVR